MFNPFYSLTGTLYVFKNTEGSRGYFFHVALTSESKRSYCPFTTLHTAPAAIIGASWEGH